MWDQLIACRDVAFIGKRFTTLYFVYGKKFPSTKDPKGTV